MSARGSTPRGSASARARVNAARERQRARFADRAQCNARMQTKELRQFCAPDAEGDALLKAAFDTMHLSARSYDRILRVARTIADLEGSDAIRADHIAEAIQYRTYELQA